MHFVLDLRKLSQILPCKIMRQLAPAGVHGVMRKEIELNYGE